jgi:hypothetical protein
MRNERIHWFQFGIGIWILVSPWLLGFSDIVLAKWSNIIFGLALAAMGIWDVFGNERSDEPKKK